MRYKRNIDMHSLMKNILMIFILTIVSIGIVSANDDVIEVSIIPQSQIVSAGQPFSIDIVVDPSGIDTAGVQVNLSFDGTLVTADSVAEGNFLNQDGTETIFSSGIINNPGGNIGNIYGAFLGSESVNTSGVFATISMTAGNNPGISTLNLLDVVISDASGTALPIVIAPGSVEILRCDAIWDTNQDGVTNIQDIVIVGQHFGETTYPPYPLYDVNGDGIVNIQDIVIVGQHFGESTCFALE